MAKFIIQGPTTLKGEYYCNGFKNAATPIIAATLLIEDECILDNVPRVLDVEKMLDLLKSLGAKVNWTEKNQLTINTTNADIKNLDEAAMKSMRSSILLTSPLLKRFNKITIPEPGGCFLGNRPLDTHIAVLEQFGAAIIHHKDHKGKSRMDITLKKHEGKRIILPEFSVTATENAIMLAVQAKGKTTINIGAHEPHVQDLITFLDAAGAKIEEKAGAQIVIEGVGTLRGVAHRIIGDPLEAGTIAIAGALAGRGITLYNVHTHHLRLPLLKLKQFGVAVETGTDKKKGKYIKIPPQKHPFNATKIQALPYPGFPTDLQEPFTLLATQSTGTSLIHDPLFEDRMRHIPELIKMGANALVCDPHRALITGPTPLTAYEIKSPNIRAGAMFVIAGLIAEGETIVHDVENTIDRGYEEFEKGLNTLGAGIRRVES